MTSNALDKQKHTKHDKALLDIIHDIRFTFLFFKMNEIIASNVF